MVRVKGISDSSVIRFETDQAGRVLEEYPLVNGKPGDKTYYYYDSLGRMTDIVRFNEKAGRLIPDYMFDYYDNGAIKQMVTLEAGTLAQGTWIYLYDDKGLTTEEKFYNAQKKLAGRMAYQYQFRK
jgi:antitoxin component YwqK of YwqJK toxin-antitoxin module